MPVPSFTFPLYSGSLPSSTQKSTDPTLGVDIECHTDIDPYFRLVSGVANVRLAMARRLQTPRARLSYAPNYGLDLASFVNADVSTRQMANLQRAVEAEILKDERIRKARTTVTWNPSTHYLSVTVYGESVTGSSFKLVQNISALDAQTLRIEAGE